MDYGQETRAVNFDEAGSAPFSITSMAAIEKAPDLKLNNTPDKHGSIDITERDDGMIDGDSLNSEEK